MKIGKLSGVALAALLSVAAVDAQAQTNQHNTANQQGATATNPAGSDQIKPDQIRASKMIGSSVYDRQNQKLGDVQDIILDKDGKVSAVVVGVGGVLGIGGKNVAVKLSDVKTDNNRLTLDRTKDQLQQAANYQLTDSATGAGRSPSPVSGGVAGSGSSTAPSR
jgi:sporulation protein YlmC with PRC-barrel domain